MIYFFGCYMCILLLATGIESHYAPNGGTDCRGCRGWDPLAADAAGGGASAGGNENGVASQTPDDDDELPWQIIAILDHGMMQKLHRWDQWHRRNIQMARIGYDWLPDRPLRGGSGETEPPPSLPEDPSHLAEAGPCENTVRLPTVRDNSKLFIFI